MSGFELTLILDPANEAEVERAMSFLTTIGAKDFELDGALHAQFTGVDETRTLEQAKRELGPSVTSSPLTFVDDGSLWSRRIKPIRAGSLLIMPRLGSESAPDPKNTDVLSIDVANAFGSGLHITTSLVLERLLELSPVESVLDIGTGSGVLGLAALRFGADLCVATDIHAEAVRSAEANARANGLADRFFVSTKSISELDRSFDLVLANIRGPELMDLAPSIIRRLASRGVVLLSGVRMGERLDVLGAYRKLGLHLAGEREKDGWIALEMLAAW